MTPTTENSPPVKTPETRFENSYNGGMATTVLKEHGYSKSAQVGVYSENSEESMTVKTVATPKANATSKETSGISLLPKPQEVAAESQSQSVKMSHETYANLRKTNAMVGKPDVGMTDDEGLQAMARVLQEREPHLANPAAKPGLIQSSEEGKASQPLDKVMQGPNSKTPVSRKPKAITAQKVVEAAESDDTPASTPVETKSVKEKASAQSSSKASKPKTPPKAMKSASVIRPEDDNTSSDDETSSAAPVVKTRSSKAANGGQDKKRKTEEALGTEAMSDETAKVAEPAKKARKTEGGARTRISLPASREEASPQDKMLLEEHAKTTSWKEIREKWQAMTGDTPSKTALPYRLGRLKAHFSKANGPTPEVLNKAKTKIEKKFEHEKWGLISKAITEDDNSQKYTPRVLQQLFREFGKKAKATAASPGSTT
ncbi:MAG: hypothetical protein M1817_005202, partial [Caeruleum heppii]